MKEEKVEKKKNLKQTFMTGVLLIFISQIIIKILGFLYKVIITNIPEFGDSGNGYYGAGFQIYMLLLAVSSMGIPGAISKLVSERRSKGDYKGAHKVFKTAFILFAIIGAVGAILLFCGAKFIAYTIIDNPGVEYVIIGLAPSVFFVCISAVIRGYFNGMQDMQATARSSMLEQIFNCALTVTIVYMLIGTNSVIMAAGSSIATSLATIISFTYLMIFYNKRKKEVWKDIREKQTTDENKIDHSGIKKIIKGILALSIPISLGSIISAINRTVDSVTVLRGIKESMGFDDAMANYWYGILAGKVDALTSFPLAVNIAFAIALIPAVSAALAIGDKQNASKRISFSFLLTILIALPCTVGYIVLADPILHLLYPNAYEGSFLLQISALAIIFTAMNQTFGGALQGMGKVFIPAISLSCGCIVKIICNLVLIYNPIFNINGAAIGSVACHVVAFIVNFILINKYIDLNLNSVKYFIKPIIANALMGVTAWGTFTILNASVSMNIATLSAILLAVIVYFISVVFLKIFEKDDFTMIPGGTFLLKILQKLRIY